MRLLTLLLLLIVAPVSAQNIHWSGRDWKITDGKIAGVVPARPANVSVDSHGKLHMRLRKTAEGFTAAEVFTPESLGFGTYQWVIEGKKIYDMDPQVVLGLFSYGPAGHVGVSGENEVDIEFSAWNDYRPPVNGDFTIYPPTGHKRPEDRSAWEDNFLIRQHPRVTTARFVWTPDKVEFYIMKGTVAIDGPPKDVLKHDTFATREDIPKTPAPLGINLWAFRDVPKHEWEIVLRKFEFVPAGGR
jgi:hypothetical protein